MDSGRNWIRDTQELSLTLLKLAVKRLKNSSILTQFKVHRQDLLIVRK